MGIFSILKVIGSHKNIQNDSFIQNIGFIDKNKDFKRLLRK